MRTRRAAGAGARLATALLALLPLLAAAAAPEGGSAAAEGEAAPRPVPLARVAEAAEAAGERLRKAEETAQPRPAVERIAESLPETLESVAARVEATSRALEGTPRLDALRELESGLEVLRSDLDRARAELTRRVAGLEEEIDSLSGLEETWEATRAEAGEAGAPAAVLERIRSTLARVREVRERLEGRRAEVLTLQTRVAEQEARASDARARVRKAREDAVEHLLVQDSAPLWEALREGRREQDVGTELRRGLAEHRAQLRAFWERRAARVPLHAALFGLILAWIVLTRRRVRALAEEEPQLDAARQMLERPVAAALLLAILASPWFYPRAPQIVNGLLGVVALLPALALLARLVERPLLPLLHGLAFFYLLDRLEELAAPLPLLSRILFQAEMAAAVGFLLWLLRPARLAGVSREAARRPFFRAVGVGARLVLAACALGLVADALGYGRAGRLLGNAGLRSAYVALIFYAGVRLLEAAAAFALRQRPLRLLGMVRHHRDRLWSGFGVLVRLAATLLWLLITLEILALRQPLLDAGGAALGARLVVGNLSVSLGDVLAFLLTVAAAFTLAGVLRFVLEEEVFPRVRLGRGVPYAVATLTRYGVLLVGFVFAVAAAGVDLTRFTILAGAFGVGIGFGLQNVVNNFVSGLILLFERPVQVGDTMQMGTLFGEVREIGIRSSTVRTWEGAEVIVPNADLISSQVVNWTLSDRLRRIDVRVGVAYGTEPARVLALLVEVARSREGILAEPEPQAYFLGFGESSLDFELRAWTERFEVWIRLRSELTVAVHDALREAGITIPFPQRDLHLRSVAPELRAGGGGEAPDPGEPGSPPGS